MFYMVFLPPATAVLSGISFMIEITFHPRVYQASSRLLCKNPCLHGRDIDGLAMDNRTICMCHEPISKLRYFGRTIGQINNIGFPCLLPSSYQSATRPSMLSSTCLITVLAKLLVFRDPSGVRTVHRIDEILTGWHENGISRPADSVGRPKG